MKEFFIVILCLFAIVGLCDIVKKLSFYLFNIKKINVKYYAILLNGHRENLEYIIKGELNRIKYSDSLQVEKILCVDYGMDKETKSICQIVCDDYAILEYCSIEKFNNYLEKCNEKDLQKVVL